MQKYAPTLPLTRFQTGAVNSNRSVLMFTTVWLQLPTKAVQLIKPTATHIYSTLKASFKILSLCLSLSLSPTLPLPCKHETWNLGCIAPCQDPVMVSLYLRLNATVRQIPNTVEVVNYSLLPHINYWRPHIMVDICRQIVTINLGCRPAEAAVNLFTAVSVGWCFLFKVKGQTLLLSQMRPASL